MFLPYIVTGTYPTAGVDAGSADDTVNRVNPPFTVTDLLRSPDLVTSSGGSLADALKNVALLNAMSARLAHPVQPPAASMSPPRCNP
jgi:hypothetical protein